MFKITKLEWANTSDLSKPEFKHIPIAGPFWSRRWEYPWVIERLKESIPSSLADMGCGSNFPLVRHLRSMWPKLKLSAVDLEAMPQDLDVSTYKQDLVRTSLESNSVDTVVSVSVLEHMNPSDHEAAILEFSRVLRPKGRLIITFDVQILEHGAYPLHRCNAEKLLKYIDSSVELPPYPLDVLTSITGTIPVEKEWTLTVLGVSAIKI